ncbi:hypothetical protein ABPG73_006392 [Tetrahymena malaccensis]
MDKFDISTEGEDKIEQTKILLNLNQISQQESNAQQFQNLEGSPNIQNELEDTSIGMSSEQTLKRQLKSQIIRRWIGQNRIFQNALCQIINQKEDQHAILSYQNIKNMNYFQHLSSMNSKSQNIHSSNKKIIQQDKSSFCNDFSKQECQIKQNQIPKNSISNNQIYPKQLKEFQENAQYSPQKDDQENSKEETSKNIIRINQENAFQSKNKDRKVFQYDKIFSQSDKQEIQREQKEIVKELVQNNEINPIQIKQFQKIIEKNYQQDEQKHNKQQILISELNPEQGNFNKLENSNNKQNLTQLQDKQTNYQDIIKQTDQVQKKSIMELQNISGQANQISQKNTPFEQNTPNIQNDVNTDPKSSDSDESSLDDYQKIQKILIIGYSQNSQCCHLLLLKEKKIINKIEAYQFIDYEKQVQLRDQVFYIKEWQQNIFESVDGNQIQSQNFQQYKQIIFENLEQKQFYLCKIIYSSQNEDLILGFFQDDYGNFDEYIFKIIYSQVQPNIDSQIQIIQQIEIEFDHIKLDQENISILILTKKDFLTIQNKLEMLISFKQYIQQNGQNYEINSQNCQECKQCRDQKTCENINCFKNIKCRIQAFLQNKKYSCCQYKDNLTEGILFQMNQKELSLEYLNFIYLTIFGFIENDQANEQNIFQQESFRLYESVSEKKQKTSSLGENIKQNRSDVDFINEGNQIDANDTSGLGSGLAKCTNLSNLALYLKKNQISGFGISGLGSALENCSNLQSLTLYLGENSIDEDSAQDLGNALANCTNISNLYLDLYENQIGTYGASRLGARLTKCFNLSTLTLDLSRNQIRGQGASNLGYFLSKCTNLSNLTLALHENEIDNEGLSGLGYELAKCKNLLKLTLYLMQIGKRLINSYDDQLRIIFDKINDYKFNDYEKEIEKSDFIMIVRVWDQETFDRVNQNEIQSEIFKSRLNSWLLFG